MHEKGEFRVSTWPRKPLPHEALSGSGAVELHPSGCLVPPPIAYVLGLSSDPGHERSEVELGFDEVYLELAALDLEDTQAIVDFCSAYGVLTIFEPEGPPLAGLGVLWREHPYGLLGAYPGFDGVEGVDFSHDLLRRSDRARKELLATAPLRDEFGAFPPQPTTLEEFRWAARALKDLTTAYRCIQQGLQPWHCRWENPLLTYAIEEDGADTWFDLREAADLLRESLALGLMVFSPRVLYLPTDDVIEERDHLAAGSSVYALCCLELFNHMAEQAIYKSCANDACGRYFVRQRGRAVHDQRRRTGVRYCSYRCARAQTQRNYKRRQRAAQRAR